MTRAFVLGLSMLAACGGGDSFSVDAAPPAALSSCPVGNGLYVFYDGSAPGDLDRIVEAKPNFVVLGAGLEARSDLAAPLQQMGVRALLTIDTLGSTRIIDSNIETAMNAGWDGVFFDHVVAGAHEYNANVANLVHGAGVNKLVVMNAGQASVDADVFAHADIVSSAEHFEDALSPSGMPAWRWLSSENGAIERRRRARAARLVPRARRLLVRSSVGRAARLVRRLRHARARARCAVRPFVDAHGAGARSRSRQRGALGADHAHHAEPGRGDARLHAARDAACPMAITSSPPRASTTRRSIIGTTRPRRRRARSISPAICRSPPITTPSPPRAAPPPSPTRPPT